MSSDHLEDPGETPARERGGGQHPTGQDPVVPQHRAEELSWWRTWRLFVVALLCGLLVVVILIALALYGANRDDQAKASDQTLGDLASQVRTACTDNPTDARKVFGDVCGKAQVIDERKPGEKGDPGPAGPAGVAGARGPAGPPGEQGPPGPQGKPGPIGKPGAAPGCLLLVNACRGSDGSVGATGPAGPAGKDGAPGVAGADGKDGVNGADGKDGAPGATGPEGPQGPPGPVCPDGFKTVSKTVLTTAQPIMGEQILTCEAA